MPQQAYALSPINQIPDFVPILGYLDDLLIVPLGLLLIIRLLPPLVLLESRAKANALLARPRSCRVYGRHLAALHRRHRILVALQMKPNPLHLGAWSAEGFENLGNFFDPSESLRLRYLNVGKGEGTPKNTCL